MARKAATATAPQSESLRLFTERRKAGLAEAKTLQAPGLFGDIAVEHVPPDPTLEEPPRDEPLQPGEPEVSAEELAAFQAATEAPSAADVAALEEYTGSLEPEEGPSLPQALEGAEAALSDQLRDSGRDQEQALGVDTRPGRAVIDLDAPASEPLGPDSFGGEDAPHAPSAQTLREEIAARTTEPVQPVEEAPSASAPVPGAEAPAAPTQSSGGFALFGHNLFGDEIKPPSKGPLSDRFTLPPFTVLDARQGAWQDRKRAWLSLGIQSEVGRGENLLKMSDTVLEPDPEKRAAMVKERERRNKTSAFGQEFILGAQPGIDGAAGGQGKAWHTNDTGLSRKLAPGGGGGGAWIGGPKTGSSEKYGREGESDVVLGEDGQPVAPKTGTSIFDPVLCELLYRWFVPPSGSIFDPFAGGSVRGIVASKLGLLYCGVELRPEQIAANEAQAEKICVGDPQRPIWLEGDSTNAKDLVDGATFDFVMACPPYADLEQYSDDPRDLSNMPYEAFCDAYAKIIAAALELLKPDRFACYVIGDVRCPDGFYRGLPEFTVAAFEKAGARKYNEAVLVTSVGSLPIRVGKQFNAGRKLGKTHQNVLMFCKGDPKRAAEACNGQMELAV